MKARFKNDYHSLLRRSSASWIGSPTRQRTLLTMFSRCALAVIVLSNSVSAQTETYDPLTTAKQPAVETYDLAALDEDRQRFIPVFLHVPGEESPAPVVLFSLGLGRTRDDYAYLGQYWAARGYVAVFVQHPGSDTSVWKDKPTDEKKESLKRASSTINLLFRTKDIPPVLDQLQIWNETEGHPLHGRLDLSRIGMSGHAFGALTTQALGGQLWGKHKKSFADPRIKAALMLSPSVPHRGKTATAFSQVQIPWLLVTGTRDSSLWGKIEPQSRLKVFPALPPGDKYELVLEGAEHSAFSDHPLSDDDQPRNPQHHRAILALSTAFWDAHLRADSAAKSWLQGAGPRSVLEQADRWQTK